LLEADCKVHKATVYPPATIRVEFVRNLESGEKHTFGTIFEIAGNAQSLEGERSRNVPVYTALRTLVAASGIYLAAIHFQSSEPPDCMIIAHYRFRRIYVKRNPNNVSESRVAWKMKELAIVIEDIFLSRHPLCVVENTPLVYFFSRNKQRFIVLNTDTMKVLQFRMSSALRIPSGIIGVHHERMRIYGVKDGTSGNLVYVAKLP
ncbi:hypothetical protein PFISCL1PPCAC_677, partial [Pristionchus fissidentatus]